MHAGIWRINEIERKKELHIRAKLVLEKLVECTKFYKSYGNNGSIPDRRSDNQGLIMAENYTISMLEDEEVQADPNFNPLKATAEEAEKSNRSRKY